MNPRRWGGRAAPGNVPMPPRERWIVTGASGQLGSHVVRELVAGEPRVELLALAGTRDVGTAGVTVAQLDLGDLAAVRAAVATFRPTHVLHLAAMTAVGDCYAQPERAALVNHHATAALAEAAAAGRARFVLCSTDMVFDGTAAPYDEAAVPRPLSVYGRTKRAAEEAVAGRPGMVVARVPLLYGRPLSDRPTTFVQQLAAARAGTPLRLFTDEYRTPVALPDAAHALVALARSDFEGLIHVPGPERLSRYELVARAVALLHVTSAQLVPISRLDVAAPEPRPADLSLAGATFARLFPRQVPGPVRRAVLE